jgi:hypothetical protein
LAEPSKSGRRAFAWLMLIFLLAVAFESLAAAFLHFVSRSSAYFLLWNPALQQLQANWDDAAGRWDAELGWPSPAQAAAPPRDPTGAKQNPDFPEPRQACASAYGDSFVWGDDIALADGWIEQLSRKLGCRVSNYGVSGYGTDQALLRFRRMSDDAAPSVILGIFPENVLRNVNQYRAFFGYPQLPQWLKGRFILDRTGALQWTARPQINLDGFIQLHCTAIPPVSFRKNIFCPTRATGPSPGAFPTC